MSSDVPPALSSLFPLSADLSPPANYLRQPPTSSSTSIGPDRVAYCVLKHLHRSGMILLYIFILSLSSILCILCFPSGRLYLSILLHKMGKSLDSSASFWFISPTFSISKPFERIILFRLLFFLDSNSIFSFRQVCFHCSWSTLDQILYFLVHLKWV